jgi:hypothetical protein
VACPTESPEATINRFIEYYRRTVVGFASSADGNGAIGIGDAATALTTPTGQFAFNQLGFTLYSVEKQEEETLFQSQFFIGPIPVNLELLATLDYGVTISADVNFNPGAVIDQMLRAPAGDAASPLAFVSVNGTPHAGAGMALFAGVGFSVDSVTAKIGVEGAIHLGEINVTAHAGAGVGVGSELDERAPPTDMTNLVTAANLIPPKRYVAELEYMAGLGAGVRNILSGDIAAKLKIKIAFFSKTWRQRILSFKGFCAGNPTVPLAGCDITLLSAAGSTVAASGLFPWGTVRLEMPFPELAPLPVTNPPPRGTGPASQVDTAQVQEFFYDSFCTCIDGNDSTDTRNCYRNEDCCPATNVCFANRSTGKQECIVCQADKAVCNVDSDCCGGLTCFRGACRPPGGCLAACDRTVECQTGLPCVVNVAGCLGTAPCCFVPSCTPPPN